MPLTLKNYTATLLPDLLLQAKKNKVRECDETEKGHFVAYVDDGNESYDVSLIIGAKQEITGQTCECGSKAIFCRHQAALIIHIANGAKTKLVAKANKKESAVDMLLQEVEPNDLKVWVKGLIDKNKDIEFSFIHRFSVKEQLSADEVAKIINDAVKAVIGNKKVIDGTQLKKLVELWSELLTPITTHYQDNITDLKAFLNFHIMLDTCIDFQFKVFSNSNKIPKFIERNLQKSVEPLDMLQVEEAWDKAIGFFVAQIPDGVNRVRMHYLLHLKNIINISTEQRKIKLIDCLIKQFEKAKPDTLTNGDDYCKIVFEIACDYNLFPKYSRVFKPIRFNNEHNKKLIGLLIENNHLDLSKKYCAEQIKYNFRDEYNLLYLNFLKTIYLIQKDEAALVPVVTALLPFTFDFDDYLFVSERLPGDERKKWRTKMLTRSRNIAYPHKKNGVTFYFKLMESEKNYRKMIEYIDSYTPYGIIQQYFERMVQADKTKLLEVMLRKSDDYGWGMKYEDKEKDAACFPELFSLFEKHYTRDYLKLVISSAEKGRFYYQTNHFIGYLKKQLS